MKKIHIYSMKRSGQHAIINWLCEANPPAVHFNCCSYTDRQNKNLKHKKITNYFHKKYVADEPIDAKLQIYNFEDKFVDKQKKNITYVTIVREPKNLIASRIKRFREHRNKQFNYAIWYNHMESHYSGYYMIYFDEWFKNKNYRIKIMNDLELNYNEKGLNQVFDNAKSSFDDFSYDGNAQEMDVLNRWKPVRFKITKYYNPQMGDLWEQNYPRDIGEHKPIIHEVKNRWF